MTTGNAPVWEGGVQELNLYFWLIKWSVQIWLCEKVRNMDTPFLVQLLVKTVQSKQNHLLAQVGPSGYREGFKLRLGKSPVQET